MLPPPALASRDVGNDDEVLVNTYNAIVPHKESNVNVWFNEVIAALADALSVDDATPKCARRVQFSHTRGGLGWSECQAKVYLSA